MLMREVIHKTDIEKTEEAPKKKKAKPVKAVKGKGTK